MLEGKFCRHLAALLFCLTLSSALSCSPPNWVEPDCPVTVKSTDPANNATAVPVIKPMTITFSMGVDQTSLQSKLAVSIVGQQGKLTPVDFGLTMKSSNTVAEITGKMKTNQWGGSTVYNVTISPNVKATNGECELLQKFVSTFTTAQSH